ncbi:conserved unknown protein [Ectocarpus siliculosus]|uniref:PDZ domain-containing protein n=1 Tax=Ectocarpus siliculosus TaxID=2880 RepID=D8LSS8_ECTSI|nr:conserved unknown protein [Ectocarpus siliculosus]|eukprot:CBN75278.1 conserved unknown protein [Ectocarpus siliculosus]
MLTAAAATAAPIEPRTKGPTMVDAVFMNKEEVDLVPIYYDPVHDFGFYRFDPKAVKFMEVAEVELNPDGAKVGVEIRVVGNDSGEKLSILPGILARLDRAAPEYDTGGYRDFNTFYLAAASSTSGGSSGSPVLTVDGKAVALNCGARVETAAAFYLPLTKIVRALELIQRGEKVTRGTLQTVLRHTAFDEARRLGLKPDTEALLRKEFPEETGVLVVGEVVPKGPADGVLEPGDVVVRMKGETITTFLPWESALDDGVGGEVEVQVQRGGKEVIARLTVGDLHAITPAEYLDVSSSVLHPLSYQQARNYNLPVEGVYLAQAGYMLERAWISSQCLITSIGSDPTPDLDACEAALCKHADGARVSVRYKALGDRHRTKTAVITIDRKWYTMQVDGVSGSYCIGVGVIVDAELGLVVVDRNTVQVSLGDVMLTFNGSEEVAARPIFSHPTQNFGVVKFDPSLVSGSFTAALLSSRETEHEDKDKDQDLEEECSDVDGGDDDVESDDNCSDDSGKNCAGGNAERGDDENGGENESGGSGINSCDGGKVAADKTAAADTTAATADGDSKDKEEREAPTRAAVVKLERLSLASSAHPQFTAHTVEVLQFDQIASCIGGLFIAVPRSDAASPSPPRTGGDAKDPSPGKRKSVPVVSAFWHSFAFSTSDGRKQTMRGLPAPVVRRAVERLRRDLLLGKAAAEEGGSSVEHEMEDKQQQQQQQEGQEKRVLADNDSGVGVDGGPAEDGLDAAGAEAERELAAAAAQVLVTLELSKARAGLGLSEKWSRRIERKCGGGRQKQVLEVRRCMAGTPAFSVVETGDIILAVNGKLVTRFREVEVAVEEGEGSSVRLTILRELEERELTVKPSYLPTRETDRLFMWAGQMIQSPHLAVLQLGPTLELCRTGDGWTRTLHKGAPAITTSTTPDTATTADTASVSSASPETSSVASTSTPASCEIPGPEADAAEEGGNEIFEDDAADPNSRELPAAGGGLAPVLGQEQADSTVGGGDKGGDIADTDGASDEQTE